MNLGLDSLLNDFFFFNHNNLAKILTKNLHSILRPDPINNLLNIYVYRLTCNNDHFANELEWKGTASFILNLGFLG